MEHLRLILGRWLPDSHQASLEPVTAAAGFSGARVWQVRYGNELYALRQWPPSAPRADRMAAISALQLFLADHELPAPRPVLTAEGVASLWQEGAWWSLNHWLPGAADYWSDPRPEKLRAALTMLARIHVAAARFPHVDPKEASTPRPSPALAQRFDRMGRLIIADFADLANYVGRHPVPREQALATQALDLAERLAPPLRKSLEKWLWTPLPMQWCLRDIWHDHILFTHNEVTGVLDFGAAAIDSAAGDVARLLGSMVGDDGDGWRIGLEAYEAVRRLSWKEQDAEWLFDATGTVLSAVNWVDWLVRDKFALGKSVDRNLGVARLERLVGRLYTLAGRMDR